MVLKCVRRGGNTRQIAAGIVSPILNFEQIDLALDRPRLMLFPRGHDGRKEAAVMHRGTQPVKRRQMLRHAVALVGLEAIARAILASAHIRRSRVTLAMIEAAAIERPSRRRRSRHRSRRRYRAGRGHRRRHVSAFPAAHATARASAHSEARRILSRSIRAGEAKATANDAVAQISSNSSSRRSAVSRLESSMPFGIRFGIEHDGGRHHRTCQRSASGFVAAGHRPDAALDQRALAAKARRRNRDHAFWQLGLGFFA